MMERYILSEFCQEYSNNYTIINTVITATQVKVDNLIRNHEAIPNKEEFVPYF